MLKGQWPLRVLTHQLGSQHVYTVKAMLGIVLTYTKKLAHSKRRGTKAKNTIRLARARQIIIKRSNKIGQCPIKSNKPAQASKQER